MPMPPVGGMPCSSACEEVLVVRLRLLVAGLGGRACASKRARCSSGSLSSVKALANSMPPANDLEALDQAVGSERWRLANGESSTG